MFESDDFEEKISAIKVVGIGSAGIRALESMIKESIYRVGFIAVNTDAEALKNSSAPKKIQLAVKATKGSVTGEICQPSLKEVEDSLKDADLVILVAEMVCETDTGVIKIIADVARNLGSGMIVGIVTLPFSHEDKNHIEIAEAEILALSSMVDSLIVIPNDILASEGSSATDLNGEIKASNAILTDAVRGITELITSYGLMDFGYDDVKVVLPSEYPVTFGVGEASGSERALEAFKKALHPLSYGGVEIAKATGVLVNITGSSDMNMNEYNVINNYIHSKVHEDSNVKICVVRDDDLAANIKVTVYLSKR